MNYIERKMLAYGINIVLRYLRNIDPEKLAELKRKLKPFNAKKKDWKDETENENDGTE